MKYSISRKINLGRFGCDYESIDVTVENADSFEQAWEEVLTEKKRLMNIAKPHIKERLDELNKKIKLTSVEERERENLKNALTEVPF